MPYCTCFGHLYAHHQELETILVLLPHMVCNALVAGGRLLGAEQQAMRLACVCTAQSTKALGCVCTAQSREASLECAAHTRTTGKYAAITMTDTIEPLL